MLILNTLSGFSGAESEALDQYAFVDTYHSETNASSYTFSSVPLGPTDANRVVVVAASVPRHVINGSGGLSSIAVGGVTLTSAQTLNYDSYSHKVITVRYGVVPSGLFGDLVITAASTRRHCSAAVWVLNSLSSTTPNDAGSNSNASSSGISLSGVTVPSGGFGMFFGVGELGEGTPVFSSWSNADDLGGKTGSEAISRAADVVPGTGAAPTVSLNFSGSMWANGIVGISFV